MKLLMMPPQSTHTREWSARLRKALPEISVVVAENDAEASEAIGAADAAFGRKSLMVGTAGRSGERFTPHTASGFIVPALMNGSASMSGANTDSIAPATRSVIRRSCQIRRCRFWFLYWGHWRRVPRAADRSPPESLRRHQRLRETCAACA
jgi:hypothetical protein